MGAELGEITRKVAYVKCDGNSDKRTLDYNYIALTAVQQLQLCRVQAHMLASTDASALALVQEFA